MQQTRKTTRLILIEAQQRLSEYLALGLANETIHPAYTYTWSDAEEAEYWADWELNQEQFIPFDDMPEDYNTSH